MIMLTAILDGCLRMVSLYLSLSIYSRLTYRKVTCWPDQYIQFHRLKVFSNTAGTLPMMSRSWFTHLVDICCTSRHVTAEASDWLIVT